MMIDGKGKGSLVEKQDLIRIAILVAVVLVIGMYLIATTVLISKDGVFYIERAQKFSSDPIGIIKAHPPGYPVLIFMAHSFVSLFADSTSNQTWIYCAQSVTLLCMLLAIAPLYFMGKLLVGGKNSFWAILILIFLPSSAKFVCDVVREWPYILFLATGFFFLLWAVKYGKWWAFGFVGISSGLGYLIRPESVQLIVYGFLWVAITVFKPKLWNVSRWKNFLALVLLLTGFAIPAVPYMKCTGNIIPPPARGITRYFSFNTLPNKPDVPKVNTVSLTYNTAQIAPVKVLKALSEIFRTTGENLIWFFMLPLVIGLYHRFRGDVGQEERFLITAFITMNVAMMILRYCNVQLTVSKRWSLPLIAFTIFYIPVGLQILAGWLSKNTFKKGLAVEKNRQYYFNILFVIGIAICIGKFARVTPLRWEKQGYLEVAKWLKENTKPEDIIAAPDRRLYFYAERTGFIYDKTPPRHIDYMVTIEGGKHAKPKFNVATQQEYSVFVDMRKKKGKKLVIYKKM